MRSRVAQEPAILVVGLGNRHRGDDAVGLEVARRLKSLAPGNCSVIEVEGDPLGVLDMWDGVGLAVVIDAVTSGAAAGLLHRFEALVSPLPGGLAGTSTHAMGLRELIELGCALEKVPRRMIVLGIEGQDFGIGAGLSPGCLASIDPAIEAALEEIGCTSTPWRET